MQNNIQRKKRILLSPLNWGLGHATRLLPIIDSLQKRGYECLVAGESPSIDIIKDAFPGLHIIPTSGFDVKFSSGQHQLWKLFTQLPKLLSSIRKDQQQVVDILNRHHVDLIISDNRYGFRSHKVPSIIITHQTSPQVGSRMKWTKPFVNFMIKRWLSKFDSCWIPDNDGPLSISGKLSANLAHPNTIKIGLLTRLSIANSTALTSHCPQYDIMVIISGPEPHRTQFEELIIQRYLNTNLNVLILQGRPTAGEKKCVNNNITLLSHCDASQYHHLISTSNLIICRSGYSTIMDLIYLKKIAILIPTPGQYEQLYLANHLKNSFNFEIIQQSEIIKHHLLTISFKANNQAYIKDNFNFCILPNL